MPHEKAPRRSSLPKRNTSQWRRDLLVAALTVALTAVPAALTGVLDFSVSAQKLAIEQQREEFARLERLTDRLENRLDYFTKQNAKLYGQRQQLRSDLDSLAHEVAQLQWQNYQLTRRVEVLNAYIKHNLGRVPAAPPFFER